MKNKTLKQTSKCLSLTFSFLTMVGITATLICNDNYQIISDYLGQPTTITKEKDSQIEQDSNYFPTKFHSISELKSNAEKINQEVMEEGAVLLKNDNDALPIIKTSPSVTLFSASSINPVYSGSGSSINGGHEYVNYLTAFKNAGFEVNEDLYNWYQTNSDRYGRGSIIDAVKYHTINEASWDKLPEFKLKPSDLAIFILGRISGEHEDSVISDKTNLDLNNGNYLSINKDEESVLKGIIDNTGKGKAFKKSMIILNTTNQVELSFLDDYNFDAVLYVSTLGSVGSKAIPNIINGTVNPSGKLPNIFWKHHYLNPVYANFNHKVLKGSEDKGEPRLYVAYQEGIYNGYRYAETRYEDKVLNKENVDNSSYIYDYYDAISYPFGYGLSYSNFTYSKFKLNDYDSSKDIYTFDVTVTNNGTCQGKEVAQLYLQKPYTVYDVEHNIEKASVELIDFAKTPLLRPRQSSVLSFEVKGKDLASYDSYYKQSYILEKGEYFFTVASDSHSAINNILKAKNEHAITTYKGTTSKGDATLTYKLNIKDNNFTKYSVDEVTNKEIENHFNNADLKIYDSENAGNITYISRNNWNKTTKFGFDENYNPLNNEVKLLLTPILERDVYDKIKRPEKDDKPYPKYSSTSTRYSLIDLMREENGDEIPFNDPRWDDLLNQLSFDEIADLLSCGVRCTLGLASINKPATIDHNGAIGMNQRFDISFGSNRGFATTQNDKDKKSYTTAYTSNNIVAATFNKELVSRLGKQWGEDCLWAGYSGIYGPGLDGIRGAFGGRGFEYYSEDPILSGRIAAHLVKEIQNKGIYVYLKHALLNESEKDRTTLSTFANEQTIREIYAKSFEIAIKEGGAKCVMTSLNKIGSIWSARQGFVKNLFRNEFGMSGFAVTDFIEHDRNLVMALMAGNALPDRDYLNKNIYDDYRSEYGNVAMAMREEAHHILYTVCHSAAMNGVTSNTLFINVTPTWKLGLDALSITTYTLLGLSLTAYGYIYLMEYIDKKLHPVAKNNKNGGRK